MSRPVLVVILDGFGISPFSAKEGNAVAASKTPTLDFLLANYPYAVIEASSMAVGLPWGEVGNSEVGHMNLGSGKVIYQNLPRISLAIENKTFFSNLMLLKAIEYAKEHKSDIHLCGIVSNGGVHGHIEHLDALLYLMKKEKAGRVFVHAFLDGRDTDPKSGTVFIETLLETMKANKIGELASLIGRYYAMDRNQNWDRTQKCYDLMTQGAGLKAANPVAAIKEAYGRGLNDENMEAMCVVDGQGNPKGIVKENDAVIFFNFRPDRARQLTKAFVLDKFSDFKREMRFKGHFVTMMQYEEGLPVEVVFQPQNIAYPLGKVVSEAKKKQLRIAETEKYAHVTYFFNGGIEEPFSMEDHILVPSPSVENYDETPRMSSDGVTEKLLKAIAAKKYDFLLVNYANTDMIGHTGNFKACVETIEATDSHLKRLYELFVLKQNGYMLILADHGNIEVMIDPVTGRVNKEHTTNPVSLYLIDSARRYEKPQDLVMSQKLELTPIGILADVAPTVLELMGIEKPVEMTGRSLVNDCM